MKINIKTTESKILQDSKNNKRSNKITEPIVIENNSLDNEIIRPEEKTELGESLKELNLDKTDKVSRMSSIDLRTRVSSSEITGMLIIDTLAGFRVISDQTQNFTLRKKRLNVSLKGQGRDDIVNIVQGKQERESGSGIKNFFRSMVGGSSKSGD